MQTQRASLRGTALPASRKARVHAARRVVVRNYVVEKDTPPTQGTGGGAEKIKIGINGGRSGAGRAGKCYGGG